MAVLKQDKLWMAWVTQEEIMENFSVDKKDWYFQSRGKLPMFECFL